MITQMKRKTNDFSGKKVLVMGLGSLGGGIASTKWFVRKGARVTVTDMKKKEELQVSIRALGTAARRVALVLGTHRKKDFTETDYVVVNPAVPRESVFLRIAKNAGARLVNDASIFFDTVRNPIIAVTGTRGKTTTANWIAHLISSQKQKISAAGNSASTALFSLVEKLERNPKLPAVVELSSWQLELIDQSRRGPDVAVITNLYPDHLNRYASLNAYAEAKVKIFARQTKSQNLILNADNAWTAFFLKRKPKSSVWFVSAEELPGARRGLWQGPDGCACFREKKNGPARCVVSSRNFRAILDRGEHNAMNFLEAALAARLSGIAWKTIEENIASLPAIQYREEIIMRNKTVTVVNDSTATSPDGAIAALKRFSGTGQLLYIAGGTDKNLRFGEWAKEVRRSLPPEHLFLLEGSATEKMADALRRERFGIAVKTFPNLDAILAVVRKAIRQHSGPEQKIILFSPAAASFGKFKNEFDRGAQFSRLARKYFAG